MVNDVLVIVLFAAGTGFFAVGSIGLLRFPDLHSRLHALTKADNVGLGCIALGAAIETADWFAGLKIMLIWILVLLGASLVSFLMARHFPRQPDGDGEAS